MNTAYLMALGALVEAGAVVFICICRLNSMSHAVLLRVRYEYACYMAAAVFVGFAPLWGMWPDWPTLVALGAMIAGLLCGAHAWRDARGVDTAPDVATESGGLRRADGSLL